MSRGIRSLELISAVLGMCVGWLLVAMVVYGVGLARERIKRLWLPSR
jgi:TRAP-type mannitol/chloroaromatic compound transport system permease small subunit